MRGDSVEPSAPEGIRSARFGLVAVFTATTFLSALLLFSVQPLFAKMVLPVLGGSPSVWAVAMCFFQAALLAGYCYAHLINRYVPARLAGVIHLAICGIALFSLPIGLPAGWTDTPVDADPYLWQLGLFSVAVGLPFLAVAANAPLLQAWFAATGHPNARDPYFLYAASNLGSLIALLGYPFVLEPALGVRALASVWTGGFVVLVLAIAVCYWVLCSRASASASTALQAEGTGEAPTWPLRLGWVGLALVPSALLVAFTTHITTDVASAPLLWVLPLALYLLTFVIAFREKALISMRPLLMLQLAALVLALVQLSQTKHDSWFVSSATGVAVFFASALVAHRALYDLRPAPRFLTEFYLWLSFGGVLGGLFSALIAPHLFSEVFEYPLLLALTVACRPGAGQAFRLIGAGAASVLAAIRIPVPAGWQLDAANVQELLRLWLILAAGLLAIYWAPWLTERLLAAGSDDTISWIFAWQRSLVSEWGVTALLALGFGALLLFAWQHPQRQFVLAMLLFLTVVMLPSSVKRGEAQRSYFGVYRVMLSSDGEYQILTHGTTLHGAQRIRDSEGAYFDDPTPATYYHPKSPMARTVESVRERLAANNRKGRYGVIGLGTGTLACYSVEGEQWRFFEIDPLVVKIARNPEIFSFLHHCQPEPDIVLGDARLTLSREPAESFDLIVVDAFTSDAVPVHLMTAEALRLYSSKLRADGIALLHISNRYLDLDAVLGATLPLVPELHGLILSDDEADGSYASSTSTVAIFSRSQAVIDAFRGSPEARELEPGKLRPWTDDYSDVLGPFLSKLRR
jgi:hypothetical protein